jgi:AcrR family transcriptional regulator
VDRAAPTRPGLSRDRVLREAVRLADAHGLAAVTMRRVAEELGVEAMSLYHHVSGKAALLDGMAEVVVREVVARVATVQEPEAPWPGQVRATILGAREVVLAHPWAATLVAGRTTVDESLLTYFDTLGGRMRRAGLSVDLVHHAMHALGSRALGFSQELFEEGDDGPPLDEATVAAMAARYPTIAEVAALAAGHDPASTIGWCDDQAEFEFGLDLILDGLGRVQARAGGDPG